MIEAKGISKAFNGHKVLDDVSFTIGDGEVAGLWGKSGAGKTTLARILTGLERMDSGSVYADGKKIFSPDMEYDRKAGLSIQMVCQHPFASLDPSMRVASSLKELVRYHGLARGEDEVMKLVRKTLSLVSLDERILNHYPHQISGGEAQRITLAHCLLLKPKLLIMDEATSMLDVMVQASVMAEVMERVVRRGGSVLLISHDRALVDHMADKVITL